MWKKCTIALLLAGLLALLLPATALATPPIGADFFGTVKMNGSWVPEGSVVSVWTGTSKWAETTTSWFDLDQDSIPDMIYFISVPGDDPDTAGTVEGPTAGMALQFKVQVPGGQAVAAEQVSTWTSGNSTQLDLTVAGPTATPTATQGPTSTPSATPSPSKTPSPSATWTPGPTSTSTPSATATQTPSVTPTPSQTSAASITPTAGPTIGSGSISFRNGLSPNPSYFGCQDTWLDYWKPAAPQNGGVFRVRVTGGRPVIYFDITGVPAGASITSATLSLFSNAHSTGIYAKDLAVGVYGLRRDWTQSTATWNFPWLQPGANDTGSDRDAEATSTTTLKANKTSGWYTWDVTALVQRWALDPGSNHGMMLIGADIGGSVYYDFVATEFGSASGRPLLTVSWSGGTAPTPGAGTPVPATPTPSGSHDFTVAEIKDTYIDYYKPNDVMGGFGDLVLKGSSDQQPLLWFDVAGAGIPSNALIYTATMQIYIYQKGDSLTNPYTINAGVTGLRRTWDEKGATGATYYRPWDSGGAWNTSTDRDGAATSVTIISSDKLNRYYSWDVTALVQRWVNDPAQNFGLIISSSYPGTGQYTQGWVRAYSKDKGSGAPPPKLHVEYGMPTPTPTASPTATATATPTATSTPSTTPQPSGTPSKTPSPTVSYGTINVKVWNDANHNGFPEVSEGGVYFALIEILQNGSVVRSGRTATDGTISFTNLAVGSYDVRETNPIGFASSTLDLWSGLELIAGGTPATVYFGDYLDGSTPTPTPVWTRWVELPIAFKP